ARLLVRCAEHVRAGRPDWVIGQASWGLRVDEPGEFEPIRRISEAVDYMVEVRERSAEAGRRAEIARGLACAFGSVGGVFVEPPRRARGLVCPRRGSLLLARRLRGRPRPPLARAAHLVRGPRRLRPADLPAGPDVPRRPGRLRARSGAPEGRADGDRRPTARG